jgi:hypothetical protein
MAFKYFTNAFKGNASDSIVINPDIVASVYENFIIDEKTKKNVKVTCLFGATGTTWQVKEDILTVVARLNERD